MARVCYISKFVISHEHLCVCWLVMGIFTWILWPGGFVVVAAAPRREISPPPARPRSPALLKGQTEDSPQQRRKTCCQVWTRAADPTTGAGGSRLESRHTEPSRMAKDEGELAPLRAPDISVRRQDCARMHPAFPPSDTHLQAQIKPWARWREERANLCLYW